MDTETIFRITDTASGISDADIDALEAHYGTTFPKGYRAFMTALGEGVLNMAIRFYPPKKIMEELDDEFRSRWDEYFLWDEDPELTKEQVLSSIIIGDTMQGDEFVFLPGKPDAIYLLARHDYGLPRVASSLGELVAWVHDENLYSPCQQQFFMSFDVEQENVTIEGGPAVFEALRSALLADPDQVLLEEDQNGEEDEDGDPIFFVNALIKPAGGQVLLDYAPDEDEPESGELTVVALQGANPPELLRAVMAKAESMQ